MRERNEMRAALLISQLLILRFVISLFTLSGLTNAYAEAMDRTTTFSRSLEEVRQQFVKVGEKSRETMASIYEITRDIKKMSRRRDLLNNKWIDKKEGISKLEENLKLLQDVIEHQRGQLSQRLRSMYTLGEESAARALFSSSRAHELEKLLKYLKLLSQQDYQLIKNYEKNLHLLSRKKAALTLQLQQLSQIQSRISEEEKKLFENQQSKKVLLEKLKKEQKATLGKIKNLRARKNDGSVAELANNTSIAFFEQKGELLSPLRAPVKKKYSLMTDAKHRLKFAHKGWTYQLSPSKLLPLPVRAIARGEVAFLDEIEGYGQTLIINHGDHYYTVYSQIKNPVVRLRAIVSQGQTIATAQDSFYFEIRHFSDAQDPQQWISPQELQL